MEVKKWRRVKKKKETGKEKKSWEKDSKRRRKTEQWENGSKKGTGNKEKEAEDWIKYGHEVVKRERRENVRRKQMNEKKYGKMVKEGEKFET